MELNAGNLKLIYEAGTIRTITLNNTEVIRMIYPAVRDQNWGTVPQEIVSENILKKDDHFSINLECRYREGEIDFHSYYTIIGSQNSEVTFEMKGESRSTFLKNRIGINVLLPVEEFQGKPYSVHSEKEIKETLFPDMISPEQPAVDIRALTWNMEGLGRMHLEFEGDVFEMEDQRNWTDASYKIYCTPLAIPFPVKIEKGTKVNQKITFRAVIQKTAVIENNTKESLTIDFTKEFNLPKIGIAHSSLNEELTKNETGILKQVGFDHYKADVKLFDENWREQLSLIIKEADKLGLLLDLNLHTGSEYTYETDQFIAFAKNHTIPLSSLSLFDGKTRKTSLVLINEIISKLRKHFGNSLKIGGGVDAYFAELNRYRPPVDKLDFISYTICPQVHAFDNQSLVENIAGQRYTVESAHKLFNHIPVHISAITLRQRFNVVATGPEEPVTPGRLPSQVDVRQPVLFTGAWTAGSLKTMAESGANQVNYFETKGWRGIIQGDKPSPNPELFNSQSGEIFPVYHVFREALSIKESRVFIRSAQLL
ncbi:MAG: hypothetical protein HC906_14305 [Bacteroidales bacterium]|nr:hypothetical protein [Bacteroidales bacterium]